MSELRYPSRTGTERQLLIEYLDWYRDAILRKIEDTSDENLRKRIVPSQTTLLGIVKHLAWVEIGWFQQTFMGRDIDDPWADEDDDYDPTFDIGPDETADEIFAFYRSACDQSRAIVDATPDLGTECVTDGRTYNLRRIMIHMIEETARHAGHADILRELADGKTGD